MAGGSKALWLAAGIAALLVLERRRPLRMAVESPARRFARNVAVGAITAAVVTAIERPVVERVSAVAEKTGCGLVSRLPLPDGLKTALAVALMDYTLYWWHVLLHRVPVLWRLHVPHHIDRDLDASTGIRFHFAEFLASVPWRCAQILAIGVSPGALAMWQRLTLAEVLFHHSNVRLPRRMDDWLARFIVTPRLHGVHHSVERAERDSNFSSGLTIWDRLHATACPAARDDVTIGLPPYDSPRSVTFRETLLLPFRK
ncbi:MAG: sterol desaturase family protein [Burkholderiales bacterium]